MAAFSIPPWRWMLFAKKNGRGIFSKETAELIIGCCPARTSHFQENPVT